MCVSLSLLGSSDANLKVSVRISAGFSALQRFSSYVKCPSVVIEIWRKNCGATLRPLHLWQTPVLSKGPLGTNWSGFRERLRPPAMTNRILLLLVTASADAFDPSCPCIDVTHLLGPADAAGCSPYSSRQTCFAPRYGSSQCDSHDRLLGPDCADANGVPLASAPAHCNLAWCYVDRVRVVLLSAAMLCIAPTYSNLTAQHRSSPIGTCGSSIDAWKDFTSSSEQGRGKTLRIGCARQSLHELPHDTAHLPRFSCPLPACVTMHPNQAFALVQHSCARLPEPLQAERLQPRGSVRQR